MLKIESFKKVAKVFPPLRLVRARVVAMIIRRTVRNWGKRNFVVDIIST